MARLVFIDDDADELKRFKELVDGEYEYLLLQWPRQKPTRELIGLAPDIFVSDLYLPSSNHGEDAKDFPDEVLQNQISETAKVAASFETLYPGPRHSKQRMTQTMNCIQEARKLLDFQWTQLGQAPKYGLEVLATIRDVPTYRAVPFVFYSRKITPEDVVEVLQAGATAAIRKQNWKDPEQFLALLRRARSIHNSDKAKRARELGMNVNTTLIPD